MQLGVALTFCSWAEEIQFEQMAYPFFSLAISLPRCLPVFQLPCILELLHQAINNFIRNVKKFFGLRLLIVNVNYFLSCSTKANAPLFLGRP